MTIEEKVRDSDIQTAGGYFKVHRSFFTGGLARRIKPHAFTLLCGLHKFAGPGGCFPSLERLGKLLGMSRNTIVKARKVLLKEGLIRTRRERTGSSDKTFYEVAPIAATSLVAAVDDELASTEYTDIREYLQHLKALMKIEPRDSDYLQGQIRALATMKVYPAALEAVSGVQKNIDSLYLYFALTLLQELRRGTGCPLPIQGQIESLVAVANNCFAVSSLLGITFEGAASKFVDWVIVKKGHISPNFGIFRALMDEWYRAVQIERRKNLEAEE